MHPRNPFYVLELGADASPGDIERHGRKLLALFDVGAKKATAYTCPLGTFDRDATMVREAMAALRDPKRRAKDAFLAGLLVDLAPDERVIEGDSPLEDALLVGDYRGL